MRFCERNGRPSRTATYGFRGVDGWVNWFSAALVSLSLAVTAVADYEPLAVSGPVPDSRLLEAVDDARGRKLPIRVYLPRAADPAPVVLFSHGLGGSRDNNAFLGKHWAQRGYVAVFLQHPGSDEDVWKNAPPLQAMGRMKQAASAENHSARLRDVPVVIDALAAWHETEGHPLAGRLDLGRLGMCGYSFGAVTTQALAGQAALGRVSFAEPRIRAAVMISPSPPTLGDPAAAFAPVKIPCLLLTGTRDDSPLGRTTPADRLKVFPHLKQAAAWQVVFDEATHMAFGDREGVGRAPRESRYHRAMIALTTAFWDAHLKGDAAATAWLNGEGAGTVLDPKDRWEMNAKARTSE